MDRLRRRDLSFLERYFSKSVISPFVSLIERMSTVVSQENHEAWTNCWYSTKKIFEKSTVALLWNIQNKNKSKELVPRANYITKKRCHGRDRRKYFGPKKYRVHSSMISKIKIDYFLNWLLEFSKLFLTATPSRRWESSKKLIPKNLLAY